MTSPTVTLPKVSVVVEAKEQEAKRQSFNVDPSIKDTLETVIEETVEVEKVENTTGEEEKEPKEVSIPEESDENLEEAKENLESESKKELKLIIEGKQVEQGETKTVNEEIKTEVAIPREDQQVQKVVAEKEGVESEERREKAENKENKKDKESTDGKIPYSPLNLW